MNEGIYIVIPFATKQKALEKLDDVWSVLGLTGQIISNPELDKIYNENDRGNG